MSRIANNPTEIRLKLFNNDFKPVPVTDPNENDKSAGKRPAISNWLAISKTATTEVISSWSLLNNASNTGVLTGDVIAFDIDILDGSIAEAIQNIIVDELGSVLPTRFGQRPKRILVARTDRPFKKIVSPEYVLPDGSKGQIEIHGEGQQFVAYGVHPKTGLPFEWEGTPLHETALDDLPCVSEEFCRNILQRAHDILIDRGALPKTEFDQREQTGKDIGRIEHQPPTRELIEEALGFIPNTDLDYHTWFQIGAAIHSAFGSKEFDIFDNWSRASSKYDPRTTEKMWRALKPDQGIRAGTLFWHANKNGWRRSNQQDDRHVILITGGKLPDVVDQSEEALIESGTEIFQRGGLLTRPVRRQILASEEKRQSTFSLVGISEDSLAELFMRAACYKKKTADGDLVPVDVPIRVAKTYLARQGGWRIPEITGITYCPLVCPDGSIISQSGYHQNTGIYAAFDVAEFPTIPEKVSHQDALQSLDQVRSIFRTFPFLYGADSADESVAISALFTAVLRPTLPTAPMFGFTAPSAGAGKSLLVDIISSITYGRAAAVTSPGKTEEEMEKRLGSALVQGDAVISLDNCTETLQGGFLCQAVSQSRVKVRILGKSKSVEVPTNTLLVATGNNLSFGDDMNRRVLLCSLDPKVERPEERQFEENPLEIAFVRRGEIVAAILKICRAFIQAGAPQIAPILGSFPEWSKQVRSLIMWLGLPDPCETMDQVRENDPILQRNRALLYELDAVFYDTPFTTAQLIEKAEEQTKGEGDKWVFKNTELHSILSEFSGGKPQLNKNSIGKAIKNLKGRIIDGMSLTIENRTGGKNTWKVVNGPQAKLF